MFLGRHYLQHYINGDVQQSVNMQKSILFMTNSRSIEEKILPCIASDNHNTLRAFGSLD